MPRKPLTEDEQIARAVRAYDRANARRGGAEAWDAKNERRTTGVARTSRTGGGRPGNYTGD